MTTIITNTILTAQIKHMGAELFSLKDDTNKEYIWEGNPEFWGKHSPVLFPIVGALRNDSYQYNGIEYQLSRHGFAREMDFELIENKRNSATFALKSSNKTLQKYPFEFELHLIYTLENKALKIEYKVINTGKSRMPFSIGAHPAFALTGNFENYSLGFEEDESLEFYLLEDNLISNRIDKIQLDKKQLHLNYKLFENDALVFKTIKSKSLTIFNRSTPILKVNCKDFPNLGIWTLVNAPFICIEPWFGYSDTTENSGNILEKEGIQILESKATFNTEFSIEIL